MIAYFVATDSCHQISIKLLKLQEKHQKIINSFILAEIASVILQKIKKVKLASKITHRLYANQAADFCFTPLSKMDMDKTIQVFSSQSKPRLSFADCSLIAQARSQKIKTILTFDKALRREFRRGFVFLPKKLA